MRIAVKIVSPFMELSKRFDTEKQAEKWLEQQKKLNDLNMSDACNKIIQKGFVYINHGGEIKSVKHSYDIPKMVINIIDTQYTLELN